MKILTISAAKYGIQNVVYGVLEPLAESGPNCTHLTLPIHDTPPNCERQTLLDQSTLRALESITPLYLSYAIWNFWQKANQYVEREADKYDIIWLHSPVLLKLFPDEYASKTVVTYHNWFFGTRAEDHSAIGSLYYNCLEITEKRGLLETDPAALTVINEDMTDDIASRGYPKERITYIGNGVDTERFTPENKSARLSPNQGLEDRTVFLSLGTLTEQKRPLLLLKTFKSYLEQTDDDPLLLLAGDGPLRPEVEEYIQENSLESVICLGYIKEDVKPHLYSAADFFVFSSIYDPGGPLTLYEALSTGLPVIAPDFPHCEFLEKENCGVTVSFDDVNTTAIRIKEFIESSDRQILGANARDFSIKNSSWKRRANQYLSLFKQVMST